MSVKAWVEKIILPTYQAGKPEKNPMFLEKRVYQGSSGVVYPHPVIESISDTKTDQEYTAVFLENEYLLIMVLPELGGRIQRAYDKIRNRDFVYYNQVIKPALVGLAGPWISGGIEFNWPQHHRPSTFIPIDHTIEENEDGSITVWVSETEIMFRTKGMAGFTLYPGVAYMEIKGRLFNRTPFPQTFLWWANPAVKVNDYYQTIFPPDVYAVFDHGKRDVSDFPVATGTYYKVNYAPGTDISKYSTIPVPTSYMAIQSGYDFMGCYENDTRCGMLHVADHHLSPGKKQWTWGNGDFGYAWDRNLTDEDGPYIELMTGVFTDNQPDFSWMQPNEVKRFEQYFLPYALIGTVKNATKEALLNMEADGTVLSVKVYTTSLYKNALVSLHRDGECITTFSSDISPEQVLEEQFDTGSIVNLTQWKITVSDNRGNELVSWQPEVEAKKEIPAAATAAKQPAEIEHVEELFLNGLHLEQYRHATYDPIDYYQEALRRSPGDVRCNNAMGLLLLRRGQFAAAEEYFRNAITTMTMRNPNPYDGEAFYNLGWSLLLQGNPKDAYGFFYKATWNDAWQHSSFLSLARIAGRNNQFTLALSHIDQSLTRNYHSITARHLKTAILRKLGKCGEALSLSRDSLNIDPFNNGCLYEAYLLHVQAGDENAAALVLEKLQQQMRRHLNNYLELSLDYAHAGGYKEASDLLLLYVSGQDNTSPLPFYYLGWFALQAGQNDAAQHYFRLAGSQSADGCFPNKMEEILILQAALRFNPSDAVAAYALGNLWYDRRQYAEAISCWESALSHNDRFPTVYRNLALASYNKQQDAQKALQYMEQAFALDPTDARILMELDQLYKITGRSIEERLSMLDRYPALVEQRDDLYLERVTLFNNTGAYETARQLLATRQFHPWEGGEGKVIGQFLHCHIGLARQCLFHEQYQDALDLLSTLSNYPENLGEGKLYGTQENDIQYLMGCAYEGLQEEEKAAACFKSATIGISEPVQAIYYNDPQPDKIVYQALAWRKLGKPEKAEQIFRKLVAFGGEHLNDKIRIDYFAVSLPDMLVFDVDINLRNQLHCTYLVALGNLGLGNYGHAIDMLHEVLGMDINHQGAATHLKMIPFFTANANVLTRV